MHYVPWLRNGALSTPGTAGYTAVYSSAVPIGFYRVLFQAHLFTAAAATNFTIQVLRKGVADALIVASSQQQGGGGPLQVFHLPSGSKIILFEGDELVFQADLIPVINTLEARFAYIEMPSDYDLPELP